MRPHVALYTLLALAATIFLIGGSLLFLGPNAATSILKPQKLFLQSEADSVFTAPEGFYDRVIDIGESLDVPPDWLMMLIYTQSKFDPSYSDNEHQQFGMFRFSPAMLLPYEVSPERLVRMTATHQLEYAYVYLDECRQRYGDCTSPTELYLWWEHPRAAKQEPGYRLWTSPARSYQEHSHLDYNNDHSITVADVEMYLKDKFPSLYKG